MKKQIIYFNLILLILMQLDVLAQNNMQKDNAALKRYKNDVFANIDSLIDIPYGEAINLKGEKEKLLLNLFMPPSVDTVTNRPLVIFIHGGGFRNNNKSSSISNKLGIRLGKKGFVVASIDYRLGIAKTNTNKDYHEAMYRAQQDARAAVRFFRQNALKYGIDENQIFLAGSSAGAMTALSVAYMDQAEVPTDIDQSKWGNLEGNGGSEGYSSKVQGVFNLWGSMIDYKWIKKGDAPLYNSAGLADLTVPYDSSYDYHSFKYGSLILYQHCLRLGIPTAWLPFYNAGHTLNNIPGQGTAADSKLRQDTLLLSMEHWLFTQLKRNGVDNNITMNGPWKYDADIEQYCNSQSNLITIRIQDHFLGEVGMTRKNLYKDDKLHDNEQGYKVWGNAIKDQVKSIINY